MIYTYKHAVPYIFETEHVKLLEISISISNQLDCMRLLLYCSIGKMSNHTRPPRSRPENILNANLCKLVPIAYYYLDNVPAPKARVLSARQSTF